MNDPLPRETMRSLGLLLVVTAETARQGARKTWRQLRGVLEPPDDLKVVSSEGHAYTGLLLIENSRVRAGLVMRTDTAPRSAPSLTEQLSPCRARWSVEEEEDDCRLPGWSEDPRGGRTW